jgi:hypothetical protein
MAESYAMKKGLALAMRMRCNRIVAESDSMEVVGACTGNEAWWSEPSAFYADCVDMAANIGEVSFCHVLREVNKVAHELAKDCFFGKYPSVIFFFFFFFF